MDSIVISYILPALGIVILLFCLGSFLFPYGERFKGKIQKVRAFGFDLEVSVVTFFVIVGVIFSLTGVYFHAMDYEKQLDKERTNRENAETALEKAKIQNVSVLISLENLENFPEDSLPMLTNVKCRYYVGSQNIELEPQVKKEKNNTAFRITFLDVTTDLMVTSLVFEDTSTGRKWRKDGFWPALSNHILKEEE